MLLWSISALKMSVSSGLSQRIWTLSWFVWYLSIVCLVLEFNTVSEFNALPVCVLAVKLGKTFSMVKVKAATCLKDSPVTSATLL